jgi:hypothetical protein
MLFIDLIDHEDYNKNKYGNNTSRKLYIYYIHFYVERDY